MSVTIKDIARKVGVAPSTVSRVLSNKSKYYTSETAEIVRKAARELGYKKNQAAVELVKKSSNVIAAVVSSVRTNFAQQILDGIQEEAHKNGYNLIIVYSGSADPEEQKHALLTAIERPVMGILLLSIALTDDNLQLLQSQIGIAGIDQYPYTGRKRLAGYKKALKEANIAINQEWIKPGDYSYTSGEQAMKAFGKNTDLTGIIAASDMTAIGILNQASSFGMEVPKDLSIVSIDGTEMCKITRPQLTSISQDFFQMGVTGVQQIHQSVKNGSNRIVSQQFIPVNPVIRKSTARLG